MRNGVRKLKLQPNGLATGIGSLPHCDPEEAVALVMKYLKKAPHWPQLPRLSEREYFVHQFLNFLVELGLLQITKGTKAYLASDNPRWPECLARFYEVYLSFAEGDDSFLEDLAFPSGAATGFERFVQFLGEKGIGEAQFLKGQIVGLLSAGFQVTDPEGRPAYYDHQLRDVLLKQLSMQAAWQVKTLSRFGLPVVVFLDDPVIDSCGRYDRIVVSKDEVISEISEFAGFVRSHGGIAGVHSCADLDWSILLEADIDVLSFDAYQFAESFVLFSGLLQKFLSRGGIVAWGIVPTSRDALNSEDTSSLLDRAKSIIRKLIAKGVEPQLLKRQSLITPSCGAGTLAEPEAVRIYQLTAELSERWEKIFEEV
ncbi:MAG: hypothetical protein ACPLTR_04070 [Thermacetogeniaceae bacterium]